MSHTEDLRNVNGHSNGQKSYPDDDNKLDYRAPINGKQPTIKIANQIIQLRTRIADILQNDHDDYYLHKWLKARSYDVDSAEAMYRNSMDYRKAIKADTIIETYDPPQVLKEYLTGGFVGHDKDGSPIRVELYGHLDMKGIMYSAKKIDLEKMKIVQCETTVRDWKEQSIKRGHKVDGLTVIFDMDNVGSGALWRPGLQMYLHVVKVMEDNYPEMMKRMFVVNAPRIFPLLWKICRPLISEDMKAKIHVLGNNYSSVLLEYIDAEELPVFLGGLKTDPDGNPRCPSLVCQGGQVPNSFYLTNTADTSNMESTCIANGEKFKMEIKVEEQGSILRWEFFTEGYDLGFGIHRLDEKGKVVDVISSKRVECNMIPEDGHVVCDCVGEYVVTFDNSYSWTRAKQLYYIVELCTSDSITENEVDDVSKGGSWTRLSKSLITTKF